MASTTGRIAAYVVDTLAAGLLTIGVFVVLGGVLGVHVIDRAGDPSQLQVAALIQQLVGAIVGIVYFVGLWTGGRRTLGMRLARIGVVAADDGGIVTQRAGLARWAVLFLPDLLISAVRITMRAQWSASAWGFVIMELSGWVWTIVLLVSVLRSASRQGLHDRAARTAVVVWW